jgi:hypothetical protein
MQSLTLRAITIASAGLLIFELIQRSYIIRLDTSNYIDSIIIIVAMAGLFLGICGYEVQTSDLVSPTAAIDPAKITTPQSESNEGD